MQGQAGVPQPYYTAFKLFLNLKSKIKELFPTPSFVSTATAVLHQGSIPIFCDVSLERYCMELQDLERKITKNTKAIIPCSFLAGSSCNMEDLLKISKKYNIKIIEDCSQAHGTKFKNKKVGSFGDASCFSFYATKHMTTGEAEIVCTNKRNL